MTVRVVFRVTVLRAVAILSLTSLVSLPLLSVLYPLFHHILGSPFLLVFAFFLLRGYFTSIVSTQRAPPSFTQHLEAAPSNPPDSSAHYNLRLFHPQLLDMAQPRRRHR